jgi:hypothetical protein
MQVMITGACGVTSRAVARSLRVSKAFPDIRVIGVGVFENAFSIFEGLFDRVYRIPWVREPAYSSVLREICDRESIEALIIVPELEVLYWSEHFPPAPAILPPPAFCRTVISKARLYRSLETSGLVPRFEIIRRDLITSGKVNPFNGAPYWMRDCREGLTSGRTALKVNSLQEAQAWALLCPQVETFMIAEFLPGRNFACSLLFQADSLVKVGCYERLEYLMGGVAPSGISGNISKGRLINNQRVRTVAENAVRLITGLTHEQMSGIVTVDLKENASGEPLVTEINLRHVAATSAFACAGSNLAEAQVLAILNKSEMIDKVEIEFPENNLILRDVDGEPRWINDFEEIPLGSFRDIDRTNDLKCRSIRL